MSNWVWNNLFMSKPFSLSISSNIPLISWIIIVNGLVFTGKICRFKSHDLHGKITMVSGEDFPNKTNPLTLKFSPSSIDLWQLSVGVVWLALSHVMIHQWESPGWTAVLTIDGMIKIHEKHELSINDMNYCFFDALSTTYQLDSWPIALAFGQRIRTGHYSWIVYSPFNDIHNIVHELSMNLNFSWLLHE